MIKLFMILDAEDVSSGDYDGCVISAQANALQLFEETFK